MSHFWLNINVQYCSGNVINFLFLSAYCKLSQYLNVPVRSLKAVCHCTFYGHMSDHYLELLLVHDEILPRIISLSVRKQYLFMI